MQTVYLKIQCCFCMCIIIGASSPVVQGGIKYAIILVHLARRLVPSFSILTCCGVCAAIMLIEYKSLVSVAYIASNHDVELRCRRL